MEDKERTNTVLLTVIGAATLLVAVVGATFAYFSTTITGNKEERNVYVKTAEASSPEIEFPTGTTLEISNAALPYDERQGSEGATNPSGEVTMLITLGDDRTLGLTLEASSYENTFCHYVDLTTGICSDTDSMTHACLINGVYSAGVEEAECLGTTGGEWATLTLVDVSNEVSYRVQYCSAGSIDENGLCIDHDLSGSADWVDFTVTGINGITPDVIDGSNWAKAFPHGVAESKFKLLDRNVLPERDANGQILVRIYAEITNKADQQNYNQDKRVYADVEASLES